MKKFGYVEVVVGAFVLNRKRELLLVVSKKWPGLYSVPGGHIEVGESIERAVRRETREETGLNVAFGRVLNLQEVIYPKAYHRKAHFIFIDVLCRTKGVNVRLDNVELQSYVWIRPKVALKLKLNTYTKRAILQLTQSRIKKWFYASTE